MKNDAKCETVVDGDGGIEWVPVYVPGEFAVDDIEEAGEAGLLEQVWGLQILCVGSVPELAGLETEQSESDHGGGRRRSESLAGTPTDNAEVAGIIRCQWSAHQN